MRVTIENNGKGVDRLGKVKDGLKAPWRWSKHPPKKANFGPWTRRIGQCCEAKLGDTPEDGDVMLQVVFWSSHYEARLEINDEFITGYGPWPDDDFDDGQPLLTRLDAQKKAEKIGREFTRGLNGVLKKHGL